jgi:hypothetical protein
MYFPSKKDIWLGLLFWATILICLIPLIFEQDIIAILILVPISLFLVWLWFTTGYLIEGEELIIKFGPIKKKIPISDITKIRKTRNPLSAPALSMDRLEILYGTYRYTLVSPQEKGRFVSCLREINSNIEIEESVMK